MPTQADTSILPSTGSTKLPAAYTARLLRALSEEGRLEALRAYQILDTQPEEAFDNLARLAAFICGTPISLVTFLDEERQFLKAKIGIELPDNIPMQSTFCQHMITEQSVLEVEDTTQDARFQDNPFVAHPPSVRFYVSAPLITPDGLTLGSICAFDFKPQRLTPQQREALQTLAHEVVSHLELRRARLQLEQERQNLESLLRLANDVAESGVSKGRNEIFVKQDHKLVRVYTANILYVEALGDYVNIHAGTERYTVYTTMKDMLTRLSPQDFVRVHRKYIVRLDRITAIDGDVLVAGGGRTAAVPIGNSYKQDLMSRLNLV